MGLWDYIMIPFGYIMKFGYDFLGNYGLALFLYALVTSALHVRHAMDDCFFPARPIITPAMSAAALVLICLR